MHRKRSGNDWRVHARYHRCNIGRDPALMQTENADRDKSAKKAGAVQTDVKHTERLHIRYADTIYTLLLGSRKKEVFSRDRYGFAWNASFVIIA